MILTGPEILKEIQRGNIVIDPFDEKMLNPNSVNLRLGETLLTYKQPEPPETPAAFAQKGFRHDPFLLDMAKEHEVVEHKIRPEGFILQPGVLYLGHTKEWTETYNLVPRLDGRSSIGRLGICVHITAALGDVAFQGRWTLEITVIHPIRVYADAPICQITYSKIIGEMQPYAGKYQRSAGVIPSRLFREFGPEDGESVAASQPGGCSLE